MNTQSEQINELVTALAKAQGEIKPALKDTSNPFFNSKYADLNSVWNSCREPLSKNNLSVIQTVDTVGESMSLITTLAHGSGQWIKSSLPIIMPKGDTEIDKYGKEKKINRLQVLGSALTYLRRYSLASIVGIASEEDDDGNSFSSNTKQKTNLHEDRENEKAKHEPKIIQKHQWTELNLLIEKCEPDYQKNIWDYLATQNIKDFSEMDEKTFHKLKKGCLSNIESKEKIHAIN